MWASYMVLETAKCLQSRVYRTYKSSHILRSPRSPCGLCDEMRCVNVNTSFISQRGVSLIYLLAIILTLPDVPGPHRYDNLNDKNTDKMECSQVQ